MPTDRIDYYEPCDRVIRELDRANLKAFGQLKLAKWDELHILRTVNALYRKSEKQARQRYYEMAFEAYLLEMALLDVDAKKAHRLAEENVTEELVAGLLEDVDPVTHYRFTTEAERKAQRLAETLEVAADRNGEIDKALRYWTRQLAWYAILVTDAAVVQAMEDAGVEKVRWVTARDERVCAECRRLDGKVFLLDEIPVKHPNCRCRLVAVRESANR